MAIIQLAEPFKSFRGRDDKPGGQVLYPFFRRNVARTFVNPFNPQTGFQDVIRALFTALSQAYSDVTDSENAGWILLAQALGHKDPDGNEVTVQPKAAYIKVNFWNVVSGNAITDTAPTYAAVPGILTLSTFKRTALDTGWQITYAWSGANTTLALKNTPPLPGLRRQARKNDFRFSTESISDSLFSITSAGGTLAILDADSRFPIATGDRIAASGQIISDDFIPLQISQATEVVAAP